ncbi:MAG: hypothetical protein A2939_00225 [Parcubacteria group bacterium RIFCSPLOWO2_01_FULL_48_18]|nr:MAG: hypothetical protein A2939_00225 [Parcubacteria group bacterium RIFCSPLOWO2_01_FULL_48_18]
MVIELKKFGMILTSRPAGREAFNAIRPTLKPGDDVVQVDFREVLAVTPSWVDEFLSLLIDYIGENVELLPTDNTSVLATLRVLAEAKQEPLASLARRYLEEKR